MKNNSSFFTDKYFLHILWTHKYWLLGILLFNLLATFFILRSPLIPKLHQTETVLFVDIEKRTMDPLIFFNTPDLKEEIIRKYGTLHPKINDEIHSLTHKNFDRRISCTYRRDGSLLLEVRHENAELSQTISQDIVAIMQTKSERFAKEFVVISQVQTEFGAFMLNRVKIIVLVGVLTLLFFSCGICLMEISSHLKSASDAK